MNIFDQVWPHLIGERYAGQLRPQVTRLIHSVVILLLGMVLMIAAIAVFPDAVGIVLAGIITVGITVSWWRSLAGIDRVGRNIQQDLAKHGINVDRRAPLQSPRLYQQWLRRNGLTSAAVVRLSNVD